jgi:D-alanyl-D-alanine carboxypeptidase/D-alanyl-D-alanine-endopeptidase (penicillin-binding protein 4)
MKKFFHDGCHFFVTAVVSLLLGVITSTAYAANIQAGIDQILTHYKNADIGVQVQSMSTGRILYQNNPTKFFMPASTLKNFTATAALSYLGSNYTFKTQLLSNTSTTNQGILTGDLYLKFAGDPTLTYNDLAQLLATLTKSGVRTIQGNINLDDSLFDGAVYAPGWSAEELNFCYAAPISAILLNKNCYSFAMVPGAPGQRAVIKNNLANQFVTFNNAVVTSTRKTRNCTLSVRVDDTNTYQLSGCLRRTVRSVGFGVPIRNTRVYALNITRALLERQGIEVTGRIQFQKAPPNLIVLAEHDSAPLSVLVRQMLKKSDNIIASALYKKLGAALYGQGTWETGRLAIEQILGRNAHINFSQARLIDGSGLSPYNQISPQEMSQLLHYAYHDNNIRQPFISALPLSGVDGTLRYRMGTKGMIRRVSAKTGTIKRVTALAGYIETDRRETLSFVILVNNFNGPTSYYRTVQDKICTFLART